MTGLIRSWAATNIRRTIREYGSIRGDGGRSRTQLKYSPKKLSQYDTTDSLGFQSPLRVE